MGKIKQGISGGFSGKVGNIIGASRKGISYMRSIPQHVHNPRAEGQENQRRKLVVALCFLQPLTGFLRTSFKLDAQKQSPFNAAMVCTLRNAIIEPQPDKFFVEPYKVFSVTQRAYARCKHSGFYCLRTPLHNHHMGK